MNDGLVFVGFWRKLKKKPIHNVYCGSTKRVVRRKPRLLFFSYPAVFASDSVCNVLMEEKMSRRKSESNKIEEMKSNNNLSNCWPMFIQYGQIDVSVSRFTRSQTLRNFKNLKKRYD